MKKMTDPMPAFYALEALGYKRSRDGSVAGIRDSFYMKDPKGHERKIKIHKRGKPIKCEGRARHRYWYGIAFKSFKVVDDIVFWAEDEEILYVIPTEFLLRVFNKPGEDKTIKGPQWSVNIYFDDHELKPAKYRKPVQILVYACEVPKGEVADG